MTPRSSLDPAAKVEAFKYFYSNPVLAYIQNWGHLVTEKFLNGPGLILDLGAGTGEHQAFGRQGRRYVALDLDLDHLQAGRAQGRNRLAVQADAAALPFPAAAFDGLVSIYCLEHLPELDVCVAEMARVLKPGGVLAVAVPTEGWLFRMGRRYVTARFARKRLGFKSVAEYETWMAGQHVNSLAAIMDCLGRSFDLAERRFFPLPWSGRALNLVAAFKGAKRALRREEG